MRPGLPAEVVVDAYPDQIYEGTVTRITPFLNPETRSADVEIEIANPDQVLKPGMFARVKIDAKIIRDALSIPRSALLTRGIQKRRVFAYRRHGHCFSAHSDWSD